MSYKNHKYKNVKLKYLTMKTKKILFTLLFILPFSFIGITQNTLKVHNDIDDQYNLEITYNQNGNIMTKVEQIDINPNLQTFNVGFNNTIISFRIRPADCPGPWVDFDYGVAEWGFTNFCLGCDDPNYNYVSASVGYDGHDWVGIKCSE